MPAVHREKVMDVPLAALYRAITDFDSYPEFLTEVVGVKRQGKAGVTEKVTFELEIIKRFTYTLEFTIKENEEVSWHLVDSNFFKVNTGKWKLEPQGDKKVKAHYDLDVGFGFFVPGWVAKKLTEVNLPTMFDNFETRAKKLEEK